MGWEVPLWSHSWVFEYLGELQRRRQRGAGGWSARITESSLMCHDDDALTQIQEFHCTEILCSPENTTTRTFHSFLSVLT